MGALNRVIRHLRHFEESTLERLEQEVVGERARREACSAGDTSERRGGTISPSMRDPDPQNNRIPIGPTDI